MEEKNQSYKCSYCKYLTTHKTNWRKHLTTKKHSRNMQKYRHTGNIDQKKHVFENPKIVVYDNICENCGKDFSHRSGLSRHLKKCLDGFEAKWRASSFKHNKT